MPPFVHFKGKKILNFTLADLARIVFLISFIWKPYDCAVTAVSFACFNLLETITPSRFHCVSFLSFHNFGSELLNEPCDERVRTAPPHEQHGAAGDIVLKRSRFLFTTWESVI